MSFPIEQIRSQFPALQRLVNEQQVVFLDGPSGTQMVQTAIDAMISYIEQGNSNLGSSYLTSQETDKLVEDARAAMADMLGGTAEEIAFGMNMTSLAFDLSRALSRDWQPGSNIVVTEIDHRANVDTWITAAQEKGVEVRWLRLDMESLTLQLSDLDKVVDKNTNLVAVGHASNGVGTINDIKTIAQYAKKKGALVILDSVHSAPHVFIDRDALGVDIVLCSAYKFFGPHIGIVSIKRSIFDRMQPYRITTAPTETPGKLETGTQSFEGLAGVIGAVEFIASLGSGSNRREKIRNAFDRLHAYESRLADKIRTAFGSMDHVIMYQADDSVPKTPTIAFRVREKTPAEVVSHLSSKGIFAGDGHFYAKTIGQILGLNDTGGWIRVGIAPYTTEEEVDRFLSVIASF